MKIFPYKLDGSRIYRIMRAIILHYLLGWSWDRIGNKDRLKTQCDHIHLNKIDGNILQELVQDFIESQSLRIKQIKPDFRLSMSAVIVNNLN